MLPNQAYFHDFIQQHSLAGQLVVQPRMGFSDPQVMRNGLEAVKNLAAPTVGTITLDSFTRMGHFASALSAVERREALNGYPIVTYRTQQNRQLIEGLRSRDFPVQIRHGSPLPEQIFRSTIAAGIDAIEGGPISYCFPYSRVPLQESIRAWRTCCRLFAEASPDRYHIESFGGCMMGQLCPPSMLIAITVAEALFFIQNGLKSFSVSLAQGTNAQQDIAALRALRKICGQYFGSHRAWHIVFYTFMGKFPQSFEGAKAIIEESARIAKWGGAERLIVKTVKEAHQIPRIEDNLNALSWSYQASQTVEALPVDYHEVTAFSEQIFEEADFLLNLLLNADPDLEKGIRQVFRLGYWDVPYCLHPDNQRLSYAHIDEMGYIHWATPGKIPFPLHMLRNHHLHYQRLSSREFLTMLSFNQYKYDRVYEKWKVRSTA